MKPTKGPYTFGGSLPVIIEGVERAPAQVFRDNDGSIAIMAPDTNDGAGPEDRQRVGSANLVNFRPKRGEAYRAKFEDDPQHAANARLFRESWNLLEFARTFCARRDAGDEVDDLYEDAARMVEIIDGQDG